VKKVIVLLFAVASFISWSFVITVNATEISNPSTLSQELSTDDDYVIFGNSLEAEFVGEYLNYYGDSVNIHNIPTFTTFEDENGDIQTDPRPHYSTSVFEDDKITDIVPRNLFTFQNTTGHIGKEYGYYINTIVYETYNISTVIIFDISTNFDLLNNNDEINIEVKTLFQFDYLLLKSSNTSNQILFNNQVDFFLDVSYSSIQNDYLIPYPRVTHSSFNGYEIELVQSESLFLNDISIASSIYNANTLNYGNTGYNHLNDTGAFIIGTEYYYQMSKLQPGTSFWEYAEFGLNTAYTIGSYIATSNPYGLAFYLIVDSITFAIELDELAHGEYFDSVSYNRNDVTMNLFNISKPNQISNYGRLIRDAAIIVNSNNVLRPNDYINVIYRVNNTHPTGLPDLSKLITTLGITVSDRYGNHIGAEIETLEFDFGQDNPENVTIDEIKESSLLARSHKSYTFTPQLTGYYEISSSSINPTIIVSKNELAVLSPLQSGKYKTHLTAGVEYTFSVSLMDTSQRGIVYFSISMIEINNGNNTIEVRSTESSGNYYKLIVDKTAAYQFTYPSSVQIYVYNSIHQLITIQGSSNIQSYLSAEEVYYVRIVSSTTGNIVVSLSEVGNLNLSTYQTLISNNNNVYLKFTIPESGQYALKIDSYSNLTYRILGASSTVLNTTSSKAIIFSGLENNEIFIEIKASSSARLYVEKYENAIKWVVDGVTQSTNDIVLNAGNHTIRMTVNNQYVDNFVVNIPMHLTQYFSYSNDTDILTIQNNTPIKQYITAVAYDSGSFGTIYLYSNIDVSSFPMAFRNVDSGIEIYRSYNSNNYSQLSMGYEIAIPNYTNRSYVFSYSTSNAVDNVLNKALSIKQGLYTFRIIIKYIQFDNTKVYNRNWSGYNNLSASEKLYNFYQSDKTFNTLYGNGSGTASDPYQINNYRHLDNIRHTSSMQLNYKLTNSIQVYRSQFQSSPNNYRSWLPIQGTFNGTLDGNNFYIYYATLSFSSETISKTRQYYGFVEKNNGVIKNVNFSYSGAYMMDSEISSYVLPMYVGIVAGENTGTISNVSYNPVSSYAFNYWMTFNVYGGGLVGFNRNTGIIQNSRVENIKLYASGNQGGIAGLNHGVIRDNTISNINIQVRLFQSSTGDNNYIMAGGITASNFGNIENNNLSIVLIKFIANNIDISNNRTIQPRIGYITGYNNSSGSVISNNIVTTQSLIDKGELTIVKWTTGALWWIKHYSHNQYEFVKDSNIGLNE